MSDIKIQPLGDATKALKRGKSTLRYCCYAYYWSKFEKPGANYSKGTKRNIKWSLDNFKKGREHRLPENISAAEIGDYIDNIGTPTTQKSQRAILSTFFKWMIRRDIIDANPIDKLDPIRGARSEPKMLSIEQCANVLNYVTKHDPDLICVIYLQLGFGLRLPEAKVATRRDDTIIVPSIGAKTGNRRAIRIPEWLQPCPGWIAFPEITIRDRMYSVKASAGGEWPFNAMRHTAISHWLNYTEDIGKTATMMGNSPGVIQTHYNALATHHETKQFQELWRQALKL